MTTEEDSASPDRPKRKPALHRRLTNELGVIISPEDFRLLSPSAKQLIGALLTRVDKLKAAARVDLKTGLPNDDDCREELLKMIKNRPLQTPTDTREYNKYPLPTIVLLDMNGLGKINKKYSHAAGDLAIVHIANVFRKEGLLRSTDYVARAGLHSDEFTIVLRNTTPTAAESIMKQILSEIKATPLKYTDNKGKTHTINVSACYGMTRMEYGDNIDALRDRVSKALLAAKDRYYGRTPKNPVKKEEHEFGTGIPGIDPSLPSASGETWQRHTRNPPSPASGKSSSR